MRRRTVRRRIARLVSDVRHDLIYFRDGWTCHYCGRDLRHRPRGAKYPWRTIDHVVPLSRGGLDDPRNMVAACAPCNLAKGNRTPEEWRADDGRQREVACG